MDLTFRPKNGPELEDWLFKLIFNVNVFLNENRQDLKGGCDATLAHALGPNPNVNSLVFFFLLLTNRMARFMSFFF